MANKIEELKRVKDGLDVLEEIYRYARSGYKFISPDDFDRMKWYGIFHRRQTPGYFMIRLRVPNGVLSADQAAALAGLVNRHERGKADITTRQSIQLRWVRIEDVPDILEVLRAVGIRHLQTGMDNVRNITGCPLAGLDPEEVLDASPLIREVQEAILGRKEFSNLPRKFNISISGCRHDCALAETQDVGLTPALQRGAEEETAGFNVRLGGAMGGNYPHLSRDSDVFLRPQEVVGFCQALLSIFRDEGFRDNRQRARLRWLVQAWGMERLRGEIERRMGSRLAHAGQDLVTVYGGDHLGVCEQKQGGLYYVGCHVPVGRISGDNLAEFARLSRKHGSGELRLTHDQNVLIVNVAETRLRSLLAEPLLRQFTPFPSSVFRRLVTCTGNDYCHFSLIDTKREAIELAWRLEDFLAGGPALRMHWSGCPNACGLHHIAEVGLQAARVRLNGKIVDAADVYMGGRLGPRARLATQVLEGVPLSELPEQLRPLLAGYLSPAGRKAARLSSPAGSDVR